jgi:hypothetical protein
VGKSTHGVAVLPVPVRSLDRLCGQAHALSLASESRPARSPAHPPARHGASRRAAPERGRAGRRARAGPRGAARGRAGSRTPLPVSVCPAGRHWAAGGGAIGQRRLAVCDVAPRLRNLRDALSLPLSPRESALSAGAAWPAMTVTGHVTARDRTRGRNVPHGPDVGSPCGPHVWFGRGGVGRVGSNRCVISGRIELKEGETGGAGVRRGSSAHGAGRAGGRHRRATAAARGHGGERRAALRAALGAVAADGAQVPVGTARGAKARYFWGSADVILVSLQRFGGRRRAIRVGDVGLPAAAALKVLDWDHGRAHRGRERQRRLCVGLQSAHSLGERLLPSKCNGRRLRSWRLLRSVHFDR